MSKFESNGPEPMQEMLVKHVFGSNKKRREVRIKVRESLSRNMTYSEKVTAAQFLLAQALRGRDWTEGFQVATNPKKVANGKAKGSGMAMAIRDINMMLKREDTSKLLLQIFEDAVTRDQARKVMKLLPSAQTVKDLQGKVEPFRIKNQTPVPKSLSVATTVKQLVEEGISRRLRHGTIRALEE